MKKNINGKLYDTTTAALVGTHSYGYGRDFNAYEEELYRKRTGEFFLWGEGGPNTRYAVSVSYNTRRGGEAINPLTIDEAKAWAEEHLTADEYEDLFGTVEEDDSRRTISASVSATAHELGKRYAAEHGTNLSALIETYLLSLA